jgi:outer membrane protein TolC
MAEAQANKRAGEARLTAEQIDLAVDFAEKSFVFRQASRNLDLLQKQLLPKQRASLEVARTGYLAGQIDFFNLTDAEQTYLRFSLDEVEARTQRELALTELSLMIDGRSERGSTMNLGKIGGMSTTFSSMGAPGSGMLPGNSAPAKTDSKMK